MQPNYKAHTNHKSTLQCTKSNLLINGGNTERSCRKNGRKSLIPLNNALSEKNIVGKVQENKGNNSSVFLPALASPKKIANKIQEETKSINCTKFNSNCKTELKKESNKFSSAKLTNGHNSKKTNLIMEVKPFINFKSQIPSNITSAFANQFNLKNEAKHKGARFEDYIVSNTIGRGAYGEVKKAIYKKMEEEVALKIYDKGKMLDPMKKNSILREIHSLESLNHPNIIRIYNCIDTGNKVVMVLELVKGQTLKQYLNTLENQALSEIEAVVMFKQIASAIAYCHSKGIAHRDLTLDNILITQQGVIKIIDFGFSVSITQEKKCKIFCGTPAYMAPEIIGKSEYTALPTDIWALGVIFYTMLCGHLPFAGNVNRELYNKITKGLYSIPDKISFEVQALICGMLQIDPSKRFTIVQVLQHGLFIKKHGEQPNIEKSITFAN